MALGLKNPPANAEDLRDVGSIPGPGRFPGGGHSNPLQYSCLENPMDRGAWQATSIKKKKKKKICGKNGKAKESGKQERALKWHAEIEPG